MDLGYDGSGFSGWARQPGRRTVAGEIEQALVRIVRLPAPPGIVVAGRTDAGVHAVGQVAHVNLPLADPSELGRRLNRLLAADVRIYQVEVAPDGFDARFSALSRCYRYRLSDASYGVQPLRRHDTVAVGGPLDVAAMGRATSAMIGEHDFAAYCRRREGATTIRRLLRLDLTRTAEGVSVEVEADAFCQSMVRSLVGALLAVGQQRRPATWPATVLAAGVRDPGVRVAPAYGLTLEAVRYPPDAQLADRAEITRRVRTRP